jgi:hypothetical protein
MERVRVVLGEQLGDQFGAAVDADLVEDGLDDDGNGPSTASRRLRRELCTMSTIGLGTCTTRASCCPGQALLDEILATATAA